MFEMIINGSIFLVRLPIGTLGPRTVQIQIVHIQIAQTYFCGRKYSNSVGSNICVVTKRVIAVVRIF